MPQSPPDRRQDDRRSDHVRLADFTIPELRKALLGTGLLLAVLVLFSFMIADVLVAIVAGVVLGAYLIPVERWLRRWLRDPRLSAIVTITAVTVPLLAILVYSWIEITEASGYLESHSREIAARLTETVQRIPFLREVVVEEDLSRWVVLAASRGADVVDAVQDAIGGIGISIAVFLVTIFSVLVDHGRVVGYLRRKIPGRYRDLSETMARNVRAVIYGALYATFLTQFVKSAVILAMNLYWQIPLALVLAIVSFFVGFFPVVGSWLVYVPVAIYLMVFRGDVVGGTAMLLIGLLGNTIFLSLYLRPKVAAEKSRILNFYWMFIGLVAGVYTFGLVGIIVGPVVIAVLKAIFDTVTGEPVPVFRDGGAAVDHHGRAAGE